MYYELYIDVLFLENFMMDSLLLLAVNKMLKNSATYGRLFIGAALGSGLTCAVIVLPFPGVLKFLLFHLVINVLMIKTGMRLRGIRAMFKALLFLYLSAFLLGGILHFLRPYIRTASLFFGAAVCSYYLISKGWEFLKRTGRAQKHICDVTLYTDAGQYKIKALIDTGNTLEDTFTQKPVNIIDEIFAKEICRQKPLKGFHYIPYRCVGREGVMPVFTIEKMCICAGEEQWVSRPLLGIGEQQISEQDEYQMILNPDVLGG